MKKVSIILYTIFSLVLLKAQDDTSEYLLHTVNDYPLKMDTLSKQLTFDDTMFLDELIASDPACKFNDSILSAYVYKNADYTFYIEYYFKHKMIIYFVCEGYIRKRTLVKVNYEYIQNRRKP